MSTARIARLEATVDEFEMTIEAFTRIHLELTELRDRAPQAECRERVLAMLAMNADTIAALKQSLTLTLITLKRARAEEARQVVSAAAGGR